RLYSSIFFYVHVAHRDLPSFPTRRSSDLAGTAVTRAAMLSPRISHLIPLATGTALIVAAAYQLTPVKSTCLRHCRDPLSFAAEQDRKSTRLNSSHVAISYAVFCLKKKINI